MKAIQVPVRELTQWEIKEKQRKLAEYEQTLKNAKKKPAKGKWKLYNKFLAK